MRIQPNHVFAKTSIAFCLLTLLFFSPFIFNSRLLLERNNDISYFRQQYSFFKREILHNHQLPLWQNSILSGSPLLGDPQNPLVYPFNYLVLVMSMEQFLLLFFILHFILCGIGMILLIRTFSSSALLQLAGAVLFSFSPFMIAHLEAGHVGMIAAISYFPLLVYGLKKSLSGNVALSGILIAWSLAAAFLNYFTIFIYFFIFAIFFLLSEIQRIKFKSLLSSGILAFVLFIFLCAPQLYAGALFFPQTTRDTVSSEDIGPQFLSIRRFTKSIVFPLIEGADNAGTETVLYLGLFTTIAAGIGFLQISKGKKVLIVIGICTAIIVALGTKTILFSRLITAIPQLMILRITTRHWFILQFVAITLALFAISKLRHTLIKAGIISVLMFDLGLFSYKYWNHFELQTPAPPLKLLEKLKEEPGYFRFYCTTGCLPDVTESGKSLAGGYNPIQLKSYYSYLQKVGGYGFNAYTVTLPPYQTYVDKPQPDSRLMGTLGVRYLYSPYQIQDIGFVEIGKDNDLFVYKNTNELPRAYIKNSDGISPLLLIQDRAGYLKIETQGKIGKVVISEIQVHGWQARSDTGEKLEIEPNEALLTLNLTQPTNVVTVGYLPEWVHYLLLLPWLSLTTSALILIKQNAPLRIRASLLRG